MSVAKRALACLDLTDLGDACVASDVATLTRRAVTPYGPTAAVCVWPQFVSQAAAALRGSGVRIATVVNFPGGGEDVDRVVQDCDEAIDDGADEIDLVVPWRAALRGDFGVVREMIAATRDHVGGGRRLKAILETGELATPSLIARTSDVAIACDVDFLKTSTGKTPVSATPQAARAMLEAIRASGRAVGFKASGGIRTLADAAVYLGLADEIMGPSWAEPRTFRFGASGLLDALLADLAKP
jgi:deoxyribose-phosphate aldolase